MFLESIIANEISFKLNKIKTNGIDLEIEGIADFKDCKKVISELNKLKDLNKLNPKKFSRKELLLSYEDVYQQFENAEQRDKKQKIQTTPILRIYRTLVKTKISSDIIRLTNKNRFTWLKRYKKESTTMTSITRKQNIPLINKLALFHDMNSSYLLMKYYLEKNPVTNSYKEARILYEKTKSSLNTLTNYFSNKEKVHRDYEMRNKNYYKVLIINLPIKIKKIKAEFQSYCNNPKSLKILKIEPCFQ